MHQTIYRNTLFICICLFFALHAENLPLGTVSVNGASPTTIPVTNMPFTQAIKIVVPQATPDIWDIQASYPVATTLTKGDVVLLTFYFRSFTATRAKAVFRFEKFSEPWTGSVDWGVSADTTWRKVSLPFTIITPDNLTQYAANGAGLRFRLGVQTQTIGLGGVKLERFPASALDSLQMVAAQARDTTWRAAARQRIEQHRKGDFVIKIVDQNNKAFAGATITATMKRHACDFATMLDDNAIGTSPDDAHYRAKVLELFTAVTQRVYWAWNWNNQTSINKVFKCIEFAEANNLSSRGHTVVYPTWQYSPAWLESLKNNPQKLCDTIEAHIIDCAKQLNGRLVDWDVVNEMLLWDEVVTAAGGKENYAVWYKLAKQHAPSIKAFVNETQNIESGGMYLSIINRYKELITFLRQQAAPVDGIGFQGHFDSYTDPQVIYDILEEFTQFNAPMRITELDVNISNEQVQAMDYADYLLVLFSHPGIIGITVWGFWEGNMWNDRKGLVRKDWTLKPSANTWKNMIYSQWWTPQQNSVSAGNGQSFFRGYKGAYTVRVKSGSVDTSIAAQLTRIHDTCIVKLPLVSDILPFSGEKAGNSFVQVHTAYGKVYLLAVPGNTRSVEVFTITGRRVAVKTGAALQVFLPKVKGVYVLTGKDRDGRNCWRTRVLF